jgi:hypothetical protein
MTVSLLPDEGPAKKLGQDQKLSQRKLRQFTLIPAFRPKIVHEFEEQRLSGFHQIILASLKLKEPGRPSKDWPTMT